MKNFKTVIATALLVLSITACKQERKTNERDVSVGTTSVPGDSVTTATPSETLPDTAPIQENKISGPTTSLALSESEHAFGDIKKGKTVEHVYEVTNTGDNPLIISKVQPGCGCTAGDFTKEPIAPGKKGTITLKFDSSSFDGAIHKQAEVFANVEKSPIVLSFTGNVIP